MAKKSKIGKHIAALPACLLIMACSPAEPSESDLRLAFKNITLESCENDETAKAEIDCECYAGEASSGLSLETIKKGIAAAEANEMYDMNDASEDDNSIWLQAILKCSA
ncbi:MAG: hypothetical protein ACRBEQ_11420 [Hyphomonas sp.]